MKTTVSLLAVAAASVALAQNQDSYELGPALDLKEIPRGVHGQNYDDHHHHHHGMKHHKKSDFNRKEFFENLSPEEQAQVKAITETWKQCKKSGLFPWERKEGESDLEYNRRQEELQYNREFMQHLLVKARDAKKAKDAAKLGTTEFEVFTGGQRRMNTYQFDQPPPPVVGHFNDNNGFQMPPVPGAPFDPLTGDSILPPPPPGFQPFSGQRRMNTYQFDQPPPPVVGHFNDNNGFQMPPVPGAPFDPLTGDSILPPPPPGFQPFSGQRRMNTYQFGDFGGFAPPPPPQGFDPSFAPPPQGGFAPPPPQGFDPSLGPPQPFF